MDLLAQLIAALGLTPAEGTDAVTEEQVIAKVNELIASGSQVAEVQTNLAAAQAELERIRAEYQALYDREEAARKAVEAAAADEILAQYEGRIATPEAKTRLRALLLADREAAMEILSGLSEAPAAAASAEPPAPMHDPAAQAADSVDPAEQAAKIKARAQALQAATPGLSWADAWAKAEKEILAAA